MTCHTSRKASILQQRHGLVKSFENQIAAVSLECEVYDLVDRVLYWSIHLEPRDLPRDSAKTLCICGLLR